MPFLVADRVKETTTTTGTGALTLAGAVTNYRTFASVLSTGDTTFYAIVSQSASEWETGLGTYSAANELTRSTVYASSNSGSAVNFSAGTKDVFIHVPSSHYLNGIRDRVTADRTYYVRTDGSDSNNGYANTAGGAFLTLQKAANVVKMLDMNGYNVTIQVGNGTYTTGVTFSGPILTGGGVLTLQGDNTTPANVLISTTSSAGVTVTNGAHVSVSGFEFRTTTSGSCLSCSTAGSYLTIPNKVLFGAAATSHIAWNRGQIAVNTNYDVNGGAQYHWTGDFQGMLGATSRTFTITGTPTFSQYFVVMSRLAYLYLNGCTFSGSITGVRYYIQVYAGIDTNGSGGTMFPGTTGSTATGGWIV